MRRPREGKNVEQKQSVRALLQRNAPLTKKAQLRALIQLSLPAIFAQLTSIMMQYIAGRRGFSGDRRRIDEHMAAERAVHRRCQRLFGSGGPAHRRRR